MLAGVRWHRYGELQFLMMNLANWSKEVLCGHSLLGEFFAN
jgi:hypothetical protein